MISNMLSNYFRLVFIFAAICIAWNEVAAQMYGVKGGYMGGVKGGYMGGIRGGIKGYRAPKTYPNVFLTNFFRTVCQENEEATYCQIMEGETCWEPEGGFSTYPCRDGCNCVYGYLRNSQGLCVLEKDCDTTMKPENFIEPLRIHMNRPNRHPKADEGVRPY